MTSVKATSSRTPVLPRHWTPDQALAVGECLQAMRQSLWEIYGPQMQQAWQEQLLPNGQAPDFDPDAPF